MTISLILAHPDSNGFNHALATTACPALREAGHEVNFHDLCAEGFDPLLPTGEIASPASVSGLVARHCSEIAQADGIVIVHPNWWGNASRDSQGLDRSGASAGSCLSVRRGGLG